jgi:hypothetical protein
MTDLVFIALIIVFFLFGIAYLACCEALGRKGAEQK